MSTRRFAAATGLYTGVLALLTVGVVALATRSGFYVLLLVGLGLLLAVLGGASGGPADSGIPNPGAESFGSEGEGASVSSNAGAPSTSWRLPRRAAMLFYGAGLALWGVVGLTVFRDLLV